MLDRVIMKRQKIVKVRKWFQKVKIVEITDDLRPKLVKKKLCQIVPVGHKVYIEFDEHRIARTLMDLTDVLGKKNVSDITLEKFNEIFPQPYHKYKEGEEDEIH